MALRAHSPYKGTRYVYVARYIRVSPSSGLLRGARILGLRTQPAMPNDKPAAAPTPTTFMVVVAQPEPQLRAVVQGLFDFFGRAGFIALLVSLVVAFMLARSISRPITRLAEAAAAMARGDYSQRVQVGGRDEIATLSSRFNEMAEEVERAHHMERDFIANVSHDLKTPLTSIQGFSQAMMDGSIVDEEGYRQAASIINSEADRMNRLVTELLNLSRLQNSLNTIDLEPTNLAQLLNQMVTAMQPQTVQAGVALHAEGTMLPCVVMADGDRLKQAFGNLVDNALKHTPDGGTVTVSLEQAAQAVVTVADTGQGIPPEDLSRVMERFYQVDKSRSALDGRARDWGLQLPGRSFGRTTASYRSTARRARVPPSGLSCL